MVPSEFWNVHEELCSRVVSTCMDFIDTLYAGEVLKKCRRYHQTNISANKQYAFRKAHLFLRSRFKTTFAIISKPNCSLGLGSGVGRKSLKLAHIKS